MDFNISNLNLLSISTSDSFDMNWLLALEATSSKGWRDNLGIFNNTNDVIPIWSTTPVLDTNEYYEFEIKHLHHTENEFDQNECLKVVENPEHCYICDVTVPSGYIQMHNAGTKHRTSAAVISHALHRASQHMIHSSLANTATTPTAFSQQKEHYCDHCSIVVNIEDKNNHEITATHIKAVKYDRQLQDFLAIFTDKVVIENFNSNNDIRNAENEKANGKDKKSDTLNLQEEPNMEEIAEEVEEEIDSEKPYKAAAVDYNEEFVILKTMKGESIRIPTDNYQGFSRSANDIQCRVCREMVVDTAAHKMEPRHIELVTAPVTDRHCIRTLTMILNHCILCNEIIGDPLSHIFNNKQHYLRLKQYIALSSGNGTNIKNMDDYYCKYCDLTIQKALKKRHRSSLDHRIKMWSANTKMHHHLKATEVLCEILCKVCNIAIQNQQECLDEHLETFDHERNYEAMLVSNKIRKIGDCLIFCQICNIRLVDKEELHHIAGAKHVTKLQKWQESVLLDSKKEHALLKLKEDETVLYNSDISDESYEMNFDDLTDMVFERTQPNYLMELSNDDQVKCKVCDVKIENNIDVINRHIETNNHKFNYDALLNYNKLTAIESSDEFKFYCEYCKVQVKAKSEIDHINDYLHSCERDFIKQLQSLNEKMSDHTDLNCNTKEMSNINSDSNNIENSEMITNMNAYYCDICNIDLENINNVKTHYESETHKNNLDKTFIEQPKQTNYLMEVKNKVVQCKVCRIKMTNNVQNIQEHIDGRNHNMTYNFLLNYNKLKKGTGSFHCEICKQTVMETMEIDHISTDSHRKRSNYLSKTFNNKKDLALVKRDPQTEELQNNADKLNTVKDYYCDVCEVGVPNYPHVIREHTSGLRHKANIDKIVSNNNISMKKKNTYYCDLCKTYFSKASVVKHVQSEKHKFMQSK